MSDRHNYYHNQLVMEDELDDGFEYAEQGELALALDAGLKTAGTADAITCTEFGGIVDGLTISYVSGNDFVTVLEGACRDTLARRIHLPSDATVKITSAGSTPEGDLVDALGDGAIITTSCPASNYIAASLFLAYDEDLQDPAIDGAGLPVDFTILESFHFEIHLGINFATPTGATPSRAALNDARVLLADMILYHDPGTGTMEVAEIGGTFAIGYSDTRWDALAALDAVNFSHLANLTGRRADYLAMDEGTSYPQNAAQGISIRGGTPRELIRLLTQHLQRQVPGAAGPAGAGLVGARAQAGVGRSATVSAPPTAIQLTAGNADAQLLELLDAVNLCADRGDDFITPTEGRVYTATNVADPLDFAYGHTHIVNSEGYREVIGYRGMPHFAPMIHDHFTYFDWALQATWGEVINMGSTGQITLPPTVADRARGVISVESGTNAVGDYCRLISQHIFKLGLAPWACLSARIMIPISASVDELVMVGFFSSSVVPAYAVVMLDFPTSTITLDVTDGIAAYDVIGIPVVLARGTWYNIQLWITGAGSAEAVVNGCTPIPISLVTPGPTIFGGMEAHLAVEARTKAFGTVTNTVVHVDEVTAFSGDAYWRL